MSDGERSAVCDFKSGRIDPTSYTRVSMVVAIGPIPIMDSAGIGALLDWQTL